MQKLHDHFPYPNKSLIESPNDSKKPGELSTFPDLITGTAFLGWNALVCGTFIEPLSADLKDGAFER